MARSVRKSSRPAWRRRLPSAARGALGAVMLLPALAAMHPASVRADYVFQPLGTMGFLSSEPVAINDVGQVCGTLTGT